MSTPHKPRRPRAPAAATDEAPRSLLERLEGPPTNPSGRAEVLAGRFGQQGNTGAWEDRHIRWTIWIDADLRTRLQTKARVEGRSVRALIDEALRASLDDPPGP